MVIPGRALVIPAEWTRRYILHDVRKNIRVFESTRSDARFER